MMADTTIGFEFAPHGPNSFAVSCPGDADGWADGARHSTKSGLGRDAIVLIENGWPGFYCFHAHCLDPKKTWRDLCDHYLVDPQKLWDEWAEAGITEVPRGTL